MPLLDREDLMKKSFWMPRKVVGALVGPLVLLSVLPAPANAYPKPGLTGRVSVASDGAEAKIGGSHQAATSADGRYVAFASTSPSLVPGDTNAKGDIFVHDRVTGVTDRVSVASDGAQADETSSFFSISGDGRYVAFANTASSLVPGDTNGSFDVFVHDRDTGTTERVSVASDESEANAASYIPAISADGRYVGFAALASNLAPGDTNQVYDVFVRDRAAGTTERVSV